MEEILIIRIILLILINNFIFSQNEDFKGKFNIAEEKNTIKLTVNNKNGNYLSISVNCKINAVALNIYTYPSKNLILQLIDSKKYEKNKELLKLFNPISKVMGNLKEFLPNVQIEKNILDKQDKAISIEIVNENEIKTIAFVNIPLGKDFSIMSYIEPFSGSPGRFKHCGCCGTNCDPSSNCVYCVGPVFTLCCPQGTIFCGLCDCPCQQ